MKKLKKSSFLEGAYIATLCIVISKIIGIIYVIPFYKIIGEQGGTLYGYAYNIYNIFLAVSSTGIPLAISKLTSEYNALGLEEKKIRMYKISTKFIMTISIISFLICFIFAEGLSNLIIGNLQGGNTIPDVTFVIRLISFALLIIPFLSIERGYLQGHRYIKEPSYSQVIEQIVRVIVILIGSYLCVYIFKLPIKYAVGTSVFAAAVGGFATHIYLSLVVKKNKSQIGLNKEIASTKKMDEEIIKKVIKYSIPFIIINLANTLYSSIDMVITIRILPKLGFTAQETEFICSVFTTWGIKFNTIVSSISTGLIISLIPHMVNDYIQKKYEAVNTNFNKCLKMILLIIAPIAIFISLMSTSFWSIFYGQSTIGPMIVKYSIIVTVFDCLYMIINSLLQSLNKSKIIYISVLIGLVTNLLLDMPLMILFSKLEIPAYYGAITATLIGFIISISISITYLNKEMKFDYSNTFKTIPRFILSVIVLILSLTLLKNILPINTTSRLIQIFNLVVSGVISGSLYLIINWTSIKELLPNKIINIFKKLTIKKQTLS